MEYNMAPTRPAQPLHIFQDPIPHPPQNIHQQKPRPYLQPSAMPLQPIQNLSAKQDVTIQPPNSATSCASPSKTLAAQSPLLPNPAPVAHVSIPPPISHAGYTDSLVKEQPAMSMLPRPYPPPIAQRPLFTTFPSAPMEPPGKENYHLVPARNENYAEFPDPSFAKGRPQKRSMSDLSNFGRPVKRTRLDEEEEESIDHLPEPEEMPPVEDEGTKPSHSYANLIGMAILRAPNRRLTLAQIYKWISDTYAFYRGEETGWQNSIRHNLSLNKAFRKQERPKGDSGKGNYWTIAPGMEMQFVKEKPSRKGTVVANLSVQPQIMRHVAPPSLAEALAPQTWLEPTRARPPTSKADTERPQTAPELPQLSSDATLPGSDPALQDDGKHPSAPPQSSPLRAINSSPPMPAPRSRRRRDTISPARITQPSSGRCHKRRSTTMDDSGYFSSLESSALRPSKSTALLTSELDVEQSTKKQKRGRAEEEIARIRGSSHDITPSHLRFKDLGSDDWASSPLGGAQFGDLEPVTPALVFKKPMRPPPSISPTTHLRFHRQQVQELANSPSRAWGSAVADEPDWSPYFKLNHASLDVYSDSTTSTPSALASGSPLRRSAKASSVHRALSTPKHASSTPKHASSTPKHALLDITGTNTRLNARTPCRGSLGRGAAKYTPRSPSKMVDSLLVLESDDLFDFGVFDDENADDLDDGVDILQGFQKIGGGVPVAKAAGRSPTKKTPTPRPTFLRSSTSQF